MMAKSCLAHLKTITIPRLELTAATLSVKFVVMIRNELQLPFSDSVFWTDSTLVLQYVNNVEKRFSTFVANRVSAIHGGSNPNQWRHVESKLNPADDVLRGLSAQEIVKNKRWLHGPEFLREEKCSWPRGPVLMEIPTSDAEVKLSKGTTKSVESSMSCATKEESSIDRLFLRRSSWHRLKMDVDTSFHTIPRT